MAQLEINRCANVPACYATRAILNDGYFFAATAMTEPAADKDDQTTDDDYSKPSSQPSGDACSSEEDAGTGQGLTANDERWFIIYPRKF